MRNTDREVGSEGFTRADLCALVGAAALLGVLLVPAMASGGRGVGQVICQDNLRRLAAAWTMYAEDNNGRMVGNVHGGSASVPADNHPTRPWIVGWLNWDTSHHNTNTIFLTDPRYSALSSYWVGDASIHLCPEDRYVSMSQAALRWKSRVRTYAMNVKMNVSNPDVVVAGYRNYRRFSDMTGLPPGQALLFLEEHPDSINDPAFWHDPARATWTDVPGALHEGASWVTFADGHVELRRWTSPTVKSAVRYGYQLAYLEADQADLQWVTAHYSEKQ